MGSLARALETFFTGHGMAMATDQAERLAAGRRQHRIDAVPESLRPSVEAFAAFMMHSVRGPAGPEQLAAMRPSRRPWPSCVTSPASSPADAASGTGR